MTEPEYRYVRGEGWVLETRKTYPTRIHGDVYIELREPKPGELCCWVDNHADHTVEVWAEWIKDTRAYAYNTLKHDLNRNDGRTRLWVTYIPISDDPQLNRGL